MREYPTGGYTTVNGGMFGGKTNSFAYKNLCELKTLIEDIGASYTDTAIGTDKGGPDGDRSVEVYCRNGVVVGIKESP